MFVDLAPDFQRMCDSTSITNTTSTRPAIDPGALAYSRQRTPVPRLGKPDDVSAAALFLVSDDCSYTTGVNQMVDGGWMAG